MTAPTPRWEALAPGRFAYERAELGKLGFSLDETLLARTGRAVFSGTIHWRDTEVSLTVVYPDAFPFFRPEVFAPGLRHDRHQNPYEGNLCLLDRSSRSWNPEDTGAWLVAERVPYLLDLLAEGGGRLRAEEVPQGEPISHYFGPVLEGCAILVSDPMLDLPKDALGGDGWIGIAEDESAGPLHGYLAHVTARDGKNSSSFQTTGPLTERFPTKALPLSWVRLEELPKDANSAQALLQAARGVNGYREPMRRQVGGHEIRITGILMEEEIRQGQHADGWLFVIEMRPPRQQGTRRGAPRAWSPHLVRGSRFAADDLLERVPALRGLAAKRVGVLGLGALGAPLALELARAQIGELRMLDPDIVEAGTIVRWPRGERAIGHRKTVVLIHEISRDYPYTRAKKSDARIGVVPPPGQEPDRSDLEELTALLDGLDVVVDCTAEIGVQQLLGFLAGERQLPQVYVWATEGGWGGVVARVIPGTTGCWHCLQLRLDDGSIPLPPTDESGLVQPRGCDSPTFTATSFDALPLVAQAMRALTATLLPGRPDEPTSDVFVCDQRPREVLSAPTWRTYPLLVHPRCPSCNASAGE